jgi:beta-galactosidase
MRVLDDLFNRSKKLLRIQVSTVSLMLICGAGIAHGSYPDTRLDEKSTGSQPWQEYPRPELERPEWLNLNGFWDYAIVGSDGPAPVEWDGRILVPFAAESQLSGVRRSVKPDETLWYKRSLQIKKLQKRRTLLHFGAVDYEAVVYLNGVEVGRHRGGNTPFTCDLTEVAVDGNNFLVVKVKDATGAYQLHGKQRLDPHGIWYTAVTGIWQTVWVESVPETYIEGLDFSAEVDAGTLKVHPRLAGPAKAGKVRVTGSFEGAEKVIAEGVGNLSLKFENPRFWTPENPALYDLKVELLEEGGAVVDTVTSYSALRQIGKAEDTGGNLRVTLNGSPTFFLGTLDQGWWPDGLLTPPSDKAMASDLKFLKAAGFNMVRKHVKVEPSRYYWYCDHLGIAVWQDQVSAGYGQQNPPSASTPPWTRMDANPVDAVWPEEESRQWVTEYQEMVDALRCHPSILIWTTFNEAWGQHDSMEIGRMAAAYDPTRLICGASGGNFWPVGDIASAHNYPDPTFPLRDERFRGFVKVVGEMGGHALRMDGHTWAGNLPAWGYGGLAESTDEWKSKYQRTLERLARLRSDGISVGIYTQTTDVESEINGLLTYDRLPKIDAEWLRKANEKVMAVRSLPIHVTSQNGK